MSIYADMMELVIIHATKELRYVVIVISATKNDKCIIMYFTAERTMIVLATINFIIM